MVYVGKVSRIKLPTWLYATRTVYREWSETGHERQSNQTIDVVDGLDG